MIKKVVIKVCMNNDTSSFCCFPRRSSRSKALQVAGGFEEVQSVAFEVTGDFDVANLTILLREKVGRSEIVTAGMADAKGKETGGGGGQTAKLPSTKRDASPVVYPYPRTDVFILPDPIPGAGFGRIDEDGR